MEIRSLYPKNLPVLAVNQALASAGPSMLALLGGILGAELAPSPALATLPVSLMIIGMALATLPSALIMGRFGRRLGFSGGAVMAAAGALVAALAVARADFVLFCLGTFLIGINSAFVNQYRFAAAESVPPDRSARAVSLVLVGGIAAGIIGPQLAVRTSTWFPAAEYTGSFVSLALLYCLVVGLMLSAYKDITIQTTPGSGIERPLPTIMFQPLFVLAVLAGSVAFGVMIFIMTATPLEMHTMHGFTVQQTSWVVQSHIVAMFLPSLFTGFLLERFGLLKVMVAGIASMLICLVIAFISQELFHYWWALVLLGVGWNFLFVGSTVLLMRTYRPIERFKAQAVNEFIIYGMQALASLLAGTILFVLSWQLLVLTNLPFILVLLLALLWQRKQINRSEETTLSDLGAYPDTV